MKKIYMEPAIKPENKLKSTLSSIIDMLEPMTLEEKNDTVFELINSIAEQNNKAFYAANKERDRQSKITDEFLRKFPFAENIYKAMDTERQKQN